MTSNRGLAGAFNANLIKEARRRIEPLEAEGYTVDIHAIGKKGVGLLPVSAAARWRSSGMDIGDKPTADARRGARRSR